MIFPAILLWALLFFLFIDKYTLIQNNLLKGVLSLLPGIILLSFSYTFILFLHINFNLFQIAFICIPLALLSLQIKKIKQFLLKQRTSERTACDFHSTIFLFCLLIFTWLFFNSVQRWGEWDSWALWLPHAKFLYYDSAFMNLFSNDVFHADYPLMLPSLTAVLWKSTGNISPLIPIGIAYVFGLSILSAVFSSLMEKRFKISAIIIIIVFTCTDYFYKIVCYQYADTMLSLLILVTFILLNHLTKEKNILLLLLIGFFAASCGWIKNEGLMFFIIFSFFFIISHFRNRKYIIFYLTGAFLPLLIIAIFKLFYAPENDLVYALSSSTISKIFEIQRYITTLKYFGSNLIRYYHVLVILLVISIAKYKYYRTFSFRVIISLLGVYFFIFITTPYDLTWHLSHSLDRLLHHIAPVLLYAMFINASEKLAGDRDKSNPMLF